MVHHPHRIEKCGDSREEEQYLSHDEIWMRLRVTPVDENSLLNGRAIHLKINRSPNLLASRFSWKPPVIHFGYNSSLQHDLPIEHSDVRDPSVRSYIGCECHLAIQMGCPRYRRIAGKRVGSWAHRRYRPRSRVRLRSVVRAGTCPGIEGECDLHPAGRRRGGRANQPGASR